MFDHVLIRVADRSASEAFYGQLLEPLGIESFEPLDGITRWDNLGVTQADDEHPATRNVRVAFALSGEAAQPRRDPDGNAVEVAADETGRGIVGRLELQVRDIAAARDFYAAIAPHTGFQLDGGDGGRVRFRGDGGILSLVAADEPTTGLHLAFSAPDEATVRAFHLTATNAGYTDNGAPGERPVYGDGYFGAFVFDPDGNNVEVVHMG